MSLIEKEPLLALIEAEFDREDKTASEYARKGALYDEYHAKYTHGAFCYIQAKKLIEEAPPVATVINGETLQKTAEITVQLIIDEIREHRKECGLDPVWYPSLSWCVEKLHNVLKGLEGSIPSPSNAADVDTNPWAAAEKWYHEYHKIKNELAYEKTCKRASENMADKYFTELRTVKTELPKEIFSEIRSCVDYIEEQLPEGELPDAFVSLKEDIAMLDKKYVGGC